MPFSIFSAQTRMLYNDEDFLEVFESFFKDVRINYDAVDIDQARGLLQSGQQSFSGALEDCWHVS